MGTVSPSPAFLQPKAQLLLPLLPLPPHLRQARLAYLGMPTGALALAVTVVCGWGTCGSSRQQQTRPCVGWPGTGWGLRDSWPLYLQKRFFR